MRRFLITALVAATLFTPFLMLKGNAMPGFARKYKFSCNVCHAPFPKLKPYGEDFAANGFRLPEGEPKRASLSGGDDHMQLARDFPIGMRMDLWASYEHGEEPAADFKTPFNLKFVSGGPLSDEIAYYFYFFLSEAGHVVGIEDAFLYFADLGGTGLNLTLGQFGVSDPLIKAELRLTFEGYRAFKSKPGLSYTNIRYDRGLVLDYGFDFGLDLTAQVVNGNGIDPGEGALEAFDRDEYKNLMFRAKQAIGPVHVGAFAYLGWEDLGEAAELPGGSPHTNDIMYYGGDLNFRAGPLELTGLYLQRKDSAPYATEGEGSTITHGIIAEATITPLNDQARWAVTLLYNQVFSDFQEQSEAGVKTNPIDYQSATAGFSWLLARNARLNAEYTYIFKDNSIDMEGGNRALVGIIAGF